MQPKKIIVLFKTHLDIGFTDLSGKVTEKYMREFIPNAIRVGEELRQQSPPINFCWTTGSWLIYEYLNQAEDAEVEKLEKAIKKGIISWHGLPFTTHSEYMTRELFEHGLQLSKQLDKRFGKKTIGAKLTDVPGHTKAIVLLMANAGLEFLHIGVNDACPNPVTAPIFRWQVDGKEITVMYDQGYGDFSPIRESGVHVYFAHTGDNLGVQSSSKVVNIIKKLKKEYPKAEIVIGDLNDVAYAVREVKDSLPVLTSEIGDTWIHGAGTDPGKNSMYRSLLRFTKTLDDQETKEKVWGNLLLVAEHTCGCDEKVHLHDYFNYSKKQLEKSRSKPNFKKMQESWQEQRQYVKNALDTLPADLKNQAEKEMSEYKREFTDILKMNDLSKQSFATINNWEIKWNPQGEIVSLEKSGRVYADGQHRLCTLFYEQFSGAEYKKFFNEYNTHKYRWAREDYTKIGMGRIAKKYQRYGTQLKSVYQNNNQLVFRLVFEPKAHALCGAPKEIEILLTFENAKVTVDLAWTNKPANRVAEALWLGFAPIDKGPMITKLDMMINPQDVVEKGNRKLFGTDDGVYYENSTIHSLDAAIAAFEEPSLLNFNQKIPNTEKGVYFNLYNNVWGTNFPMWYDEDARFRFVIDIK